MEGPRTLSGLPFSKANCRIGAPLTGRSGSAPRRIQGAQISRAQAKGHHALAGLHRRPSRRSPFTRATAVKSPLPPPLRVAERNSPSPRLHRRSLRRGHATQRRHRSPRPHISVWAGTSGGRDCPTPRFPRVSSTSSQKHGAVAEPAPMWEHPLSRKTPIGTGVAVFLRNRPGPSIPSHLPSPLNPGKSGLFPQNNQTLRLGPRINKNSPIHTHQREPPNSPYPQPLPSQLNNRRP